jgi:Predicted transcriptional regulator, consists of a Zn-ribbon and ATP-cone domains
MYFQKNGCKKTGVRQEYDRLKLEKSIRISCTKRPISEQIIQEIMMNIEKKINDIANVEISSKKIGKIIMDELKVVDKVAFIRFSSVYREFKDIGEFKTQIDDLSK